MGSLVSQVYELELAEPKTVTIRVPRFQNKLYEGAMEAQLMMVYNANKRLMGSTDTWPDPLKLPKGKYQVHLGLRHQDEAKLKSMVGMAIACDYDMTKAVPVSPYNHHNSAATSLDAGKWSTKRLVAKGETAAVFMAVDEAACDAVKDAKPGDMLMGKVLWEDEEVDRPWEEGKHKGHGSRLQYVVGAARPVPKTAAAAAAAGTTGGDDSKDGDKEVDVVAKAVRDAKLACLVKMRGKDTKDKHAALLADLLEADAADRKVLAEALARVVDDAKPDDANADDAIALTAVIAAADAVIAAVDEVSVRALLAQRASEQAAADEKKARKDGEEEKEALLNALVQKADAQARIVLASPAEAGADAGADGASAAVATALKATVKQLGSWVDIEDKYTKVLCNCERAMGNAGLALKLVDKCLAKDQTEPLFKLRAKLYAECGYDHLAKAEDKRLALLFPKGFEPF